MQVKELRQRKGSEFYADCFHELGQQWDAGIIDRDTFIKELDNVMRGENRYYFIHLYLRDDDIISLEEMHGYILGNCCLNFFRELHINGRLPTKHLQEVSKQLATQALHNNTAPQLFAYLHTSGYLDLRPGSIDWNPLEYVDIMTPHALHFLIELGWGDFDKEYQRFDDGQATVSCMENAFSRHMSAEGNPHKAANIALLLSNDRFTCSLKNCWWMHMDLATFVVLEQHFSKEELLQFVVRSTRAIGQQGDCDIWPYLYANYHLCFYQDHMMFVFQALERMYYTLPRDGIITSEWLLGTFRHPEVFLRKLGVILSYNPVPCTFKPAPNLVQLDRYLVWNRRGAPHFSLSIRRPLFTLLLVTRRQFGSSLVFKDLLPLIVKWMVSDDGFAERVKEILYEKEETSQSWCLLL